MPRQVYWDVERTRSFLEILGACYNNSRGGIPPTPVYEECVRKLCEIYGPESYNIESLRSKFQRMKTHYKIYVNISTNIGLGWDEETQNVVAPAHVIKEFTKVISSTCSCTIYLFVICLYLVYTFICWLILKFLLYFKGDKDT